MQTLNLIQQNNGIGKCCILSYCYVLGLEVGGVFAKKVNKKG
jgi:hypothetical protein